MDNIYGFIYIIKNDLNNKVYIGKTTTTIEKRFIRHCKDGKNESNKLSIDYAINKYGKEHFTIKEIEKSGLSYLSDREIYWIKYYDSYRNGYNLTLGGEGNLLYTEEEVY